MNINSFEEFEIKSRAAGFDEVTQRDWQPDSAVSQHTHAFDAYAVLVQGEMWLRCDGIARHMKPGETFSLPKGTPHSERYGSMGARLWVARRN
jgi:quercetin dioxygenase-like cupin family protein